jgi:putative lysine transport system ATP-binding protein
MALLQMNFRSKVLNLDSPVNLILPEDNGGVGKPPYKLLYLLHGYSDDQNAWLKNTRIHSHVWGRNIAVVMPAAAHSFYHNECHGKRYWDFVSEELPMMVHRYFNLPENRETTYVAGLSMGGYGAAKLALNHPERFAGAICLSGAMDCGMNESGFIPPNFYDMFESEEAYLNSNGNLFKLAPEVAKLPAGQKPRFFLTCGTKDFLRCEVLRFDKMMRGLDFDYTYIEDMGFEHTWDYWDYRIQTGLDWAFGK